MGRLGPGRRLLEVLWPLRNYGIGARVTKPTWTGPDCFWQITKLKYNKRAVRDGSIRLGKAWGTLHWRGTPVGRPDRRVPGHSKAMWQLFGDTPPPATDDCAQLRTLDALGGGVASTPAAPQPPAPPDAATDEARRLAEASTAAAIREAYAREQAAARDAPRPAVAAPAASTEDEDSDDAPLESLVTVRRRDGCRCS